MTLTKRELASRIADKTGYTSTESLQIIQAAINVISDELQRGNRIELRDFGVLGVKKRKSRIGRNPNKPQVTFKVPARYQVYFKTGRNLKKQIAKSLGTPKT